MKSLTTVILAALFCTSIRAQLNIQPDTRVNISQGGYIVATGNINSVVSFLGRGTLVMKGATLQMLDMNGVNITNLTVDNPANVSLVKAMNIGDKLSFIRGKVLLNNNSLFLSDTGSVVGAATGRFVETNGTGQLRKRTKKDLSSFLMPVGAGTNYAPVVITTSGTYATANVGVYNKGTAHPDKPSTVANYLNTYWSVSRAGITGSLSAVATYNAANVIGNESLLKGYLKTGTTFTTTGASINTTTNKITGNITGTGNAVYAMSSASGVSSAGTLEPLSANDRLYPNPAVTESLLELYSDINENVQLSIVDVTGRIVWTRKVNITAQVNQLRIDVAMLKPGIYQVQVKGETINKMFSLIRKER